MVTIINPKNHYYFLTIVFHHLIFAFNYIMNNITSLTIIPLPNESVFEGKKRFNFFFYSCIYFADFQILIIVVDFLFIQEYFGHYFLAKWRKTSFLKN
jgi:hypothetical protein